MLKTYNELRAIDVTPWCDYRDAKDERGRATKVPYLSWATCLDLLHQNGAEEVWYEPLENEHGSVLFSAAETTNKDGRKCGNYFVKVRIHIDSLEFDFTYPLMNGSLVVWEDTLTQLRISNAHARAFVKGVAMRTGLGFGLWLDDKDTDPTEAKEDLSQHNPYKVKAYIEELCTQKIKKGISEDDLLSGLGITKKQLLSILKGLENAGWLLGELKK